MTSLLGIPLADFTTNLATAIVVGGTTATLQSATDDDSIVLPTGRYFFSLDGENSNKEHFSCTLTGTSLTNLKSISRQGIETAGAVRSHRIGTTVSLTDFAHLVYMNNLLNGTTTFNASIPLGYDGTASVTTANQFATKAYVDGVAIAGAPNANTTTKGIVQEATQAQMLAKTAVGSTGAELYVNPSTLANSLLSDYKADTGAANAYAIAPAPAVIAYTVGQIFSFKAVNANITVSTLNVNALGVKTIKKAGGATDLASGDIAAGMVVLVEYDGTNFVMLNPVANTVTLTTNTYPVGNGANITGVHADIQTFTGNGTWTKPTGALSVLVQVWGAGGAGGGVAAAVSEAGGGGGGGGYSEERYQASDLTATVAVTVGAGGTGVSANTGNSGGNSSFGAFTIAYGGGGGTIGTNGTGGVGGTGGSGETGQGTGLYAGGISGGTNVGGGASTFGGGGGGGGAAGGGPGGGGAAAWFGGGGGGGGSVTGAGGAGGTLKTGFGGAGAAGSTGVGPGNSAGTLAGGGGGAAVNGGIAAVGGAGFRGQIVVTTFF